jgi:hypothetical protein
MAMMKTFPRKTSQAAMPSSLTGLPELRNFPHEGGSFCFSL